MLAPTKRSHQEHVDPVNTTHNLPPFSLPRSQGGVGEFMTPQDAIRQLQEGRNFQAGFIGVSEKFAYLIANKL